jgi:hypothetical protein
MHFFILGSKKTKKIEFCKLLFTSFWKYVSINTYTLKIGDFQMEETKTNRSHKASVFTELFSEKSKLLELYNAISGKSYPLAATASLLPRLREILRR